MKKALVKFSGVIASLALTAGMTIYVLALVRGCQ